MEKAEQAAFSFESFKVPRFSYDDKNASGKKLKVGFKPKGEYSEKKGLFTITLEFITYDEDESNMIFKLTSVAVFKFEQPISIENIPDFFYKNSIAIMFPYVRAFISTLTLQANTKLLNLGLMNLSNLEEPLRENTVAV